MDLRADFATVLTNDFDLLLRQSSRRLGATFETDFALLMNAEFMLFLNPG